MKILLANFTRMVGDTGGMAKVTSAFANEMIRRGHQVSMMYSDEKDGEFFFPVDKSVKLYNIKKNIDGSIIKFPLYLKAFREVSRIFWKRGSRTINGWFDKRNLLDNIQRYLEEDKPDIIIASQTAATKLLLIDLNVEYPLVSMSHGPTADYFTHYPVNEVPALEKADVCQVLIHAYENDLKKYYPDLNVVVIGNGIPQYDFSADLVTKKEQYKIIFIGRLAKTHKRPHLLIKAFAKLRDKYPNWIVELWGDKDSKSYYKELQMIINSNSLKNKVFLRGSTDDIPSKLREADILAFPSAFEGFSLALGEGMSAGLPAVGYKNAPSVNEVIIDGKTGFLVDDGVDPFAEALDKLMSDRDLRVRMGKAAKEEMAEFAPEKIWDKWEELMNSVVKNHIVNK